MDKAQMRRDFDERGFVVVRDFFQPEVVAGVRAEVEKMVDEHVQKLLDEGKIADAFSDEPLETRLYRLYEKSPRDAPGTYRAELHRPGFFGFFFHPGLLDVAELYLGGEIRLYPNYSLRPKLPGGTRVVWHQDGGFTEEFQMGEVQAMRMVNVWSPLVPARRENGCMRFVPGTHKMGSVPHERVGRDLKIADQYVEPVLPEAVWIELDPGDLVLFHNLLFHEGAPNNARIVRWSLDWRYQDAAQPTMRPHHGHIARSNDNPSTAVKSAEEWARLSFG